MAVFDRIIAVNLKGVLMGCKHAIPPMLARGGGAIVNTASIDGLVARGVCAAYGAAKAGLMLATKNVAAQYGAARHPLQRGRTRPGADARSRPRCPGADPGGVPDLSDA
jgi:NADP-dependent 3-hydroxy acid dehydrogenase YdfG